MLFLLASSDARMDHTQAHRTLSTVRSGSSFMVVLLSLVLSVGAAAASAPFWESMLITGTAFWTMNEKEV